jgi:hypothetical protein
MDSVSRRVAAASLVDAATNVVHPSIDGKRVNGLFQAALFRSEKHRKQAKTNVCMHFGPE